VTDLSRLEHGRDSRHPGGKIQGPWVRVSTDGIKAPTTIKMVVKKATDRPKGDVPDGPVAFVFEWKTDGEEGGSRERVLLDPTRNPKTLDFVYEGKGAPQLCPGIYKLEGDP
jgi:uncharacterized protein (TIGR03067 family)